MTTWTPAAVASSRFKGAFESWRCVEAQHVVSTMRVVDTVAEQRVLEMLIDQAKPASPRNVDGLHYLLAAPFRYRPQPPGSRFRAPDDAGVFYAAREIRTACAEVAWWRWKGILGDTPALEHLPPASFTILPVQVRDDTVDLRRPPLDADRAVWTHPADYTGTQAFARVAREAGVGILVYESVRDPQHGANVAALRPAALRGLDETRQQTWQLLVSRTTANWVRAGSAGFSFAAAMWE